MKKTISYTDINGNTVIVETSIENTHLVISMGNTIMYFDKDKADSLIEEMDSFRRELKAIN